MSICLFHSREDFRKGIGGERKKRGGEMSDVVIQASATLSVRDNECSKNNGSDQTFKVMMCRVILNTYHNELGNGSHLTI